MNGATETKNSPSGRSYICSPPSSVTISDSESMEADSAILPALSSATYSLMLPASLSALLEHPARIASSPISGTHRYLFMHSPPFSSIISTPGFKRLRIYNDFMNCTRVIPRNYEKIQEKGTEMLMLEGSRNNVNIQKDDWQDYDITFFTEDMYKLYGKGN